MNKLIVWVLTSLVVLYSVVADTSNPAVKNYFASLGSMVSSTSATGFIVVILLVVIWWWYKRG